MKPRHPKLTAECQTISEVLARVGDKWTVLVVSSLGDGPLRFSALRRVIDGISQKMLTATLRTLERDGFCTRKVFPTVPPRVEYELTELGRDLLVPVKALAEWAVANRERLSSARRLFDAHSTAVGETRPYDPPLAAKAVAPQGG